ncbi:hypothetical protein ACFRAQ_35155 [Nocardia sp. NPDC056611]|uniref:hypothetical protein n=1 Tax=Nocardia sp. NPDC056611 TaxID=3345877 RepID=UPI00366F5F39
MAIKTAVYRGNAGMQIYVPGYVEVDEMRQISDMGIVELYVRYDDTNLDEIYLVSLHPNVDAPLEVPGWIELGKIFIRGGQYAYMYVEKYLMPPVVPPGLPAYLPVELRAMTLVGDVYNFRAPIPGFVRIDKVRQVGNADSLKFEFHVVIDINKRSEVGNLVVSLQADPVSPTDTDHTVLDVVDLNGGWQYMTYTYTPVPASP